ncbi:MAG TPA: hypothetical protein VIG34_10255 [Xanthobacteraceae bacterium]|jgi:hypothetical protein
MSLPASSAEQTRFARGIALAALAAAIVNFIAFYPGLLHHDAWAYFRAVRANDWTNWQPPLLGFMWIPLQKIYYGPQPMLVLFVAGYWAGFALLAIAYAKRDRRLAFWTFIAAFFPLAINFNGQLVKDISMAVCLLLVVALAAGIEFGWIRRKRLAIPAIWLFFVSGAFMRANSLFGLPPVFELAAGASSWRWVSLPLVRRAVIACLIALAVAPGHIIADRYLFRVVDIHPISQLQVFDLGGITFNSGDDAFKGFFGPNFVQRNATCYTPRHWDVYGWGGCPEVYENLKPRFGEDLWKLWVEGIAAHPIAYVHHRLAHANRFFQFFCTSCKEIVFTGAQSTNQKEFTFEPTFLYKAIEAAAEAINNSPFGRPYVFLLICLAWSLAAFGIKDTIIQRFTLLIALSGAMYALGFVAIGIAHEYRYIFWTMLCAAITTPAIVMHVLARGDAPTALRIIPPLLIVGIIAIREAVVRLLL